MDEEKFILTLAEIKQANNVLLTTHARPDGDAISSLCILIELLTSLNKNFLAYSQDHILHQYSYLPHTEKIITDKNKINFTKYDLIITLDCGSLSRTNFEEEIKIKNSEQFIIEFDHHPQIDDYADIVNRYPDCASTTEVLYYFLHANNIAINKNYANCILTGILTDTGNFLFPNTSDRSINIGSEMLVYGAQFPRIVENTWRNKSLPAMHIWGKALSHLKINKKYNFAFSIITKDEMDKNNVSEEELENLSNFISNLYGVKGVMLLRETDKGEIKGSLRTSHPQIDISKLARALGGGGHKKASGFRINATLQEVDGKWEIV